MVKAKQIQIDGSYPETQLLTATSTILVRPGLAEDLIAVASDENITLTGSPLQTASILERQQITIVNSGVFDITIPASSAIKSGGLPIVIRSGSAATFIYRSALDQWIAMTNGSMALQHADDVAISGGTISGDTIYSGSEANLNDRPFSEILTELENRVFTVGFVSPSLNDPQTGAMESLMNSSDGTNPDEWLLIQFAGSGANPNTRVGIFYKNPAGDLEKVPALAPFGAIPRGALIFAKIVGVYYLASVTGEAQPHYFFDALAPVTQVEGDDPIIANTNESGFVTIELSSVFLENLESLEDDVGGKLDVGLIGTPGGVAGLDLASKVPNLQIHWEAPSDIGGATPAVGRFTNLYSTDTEQATNTSTGALRSAGGGSVAGNWFVGQLLSTAELQLRLLGRTHTIESGATANRILRLPDSSGDIRLAIPDNPLPEMFSHFVEGSLSHWEISSTGTAANTTFNAVDANATGIAQMETGTFASGRTAVVSRANGTALVAVFRFDLHPRWVYKARFKIVTLNNGTDGFALRMGWLNSISAVPTEGMYFGYLPGLTNLQVITVTGGSANSSASTVAATTDWMTIEIRRSATAAEFFINDVLVETKTTQLPVACGAGAALIKSQGNATRLVHVDYQYTGARN
jgi:hypothetical protein